MDMDDAKSIRSCRTPDIEDEHVQSTYLMEKSKELCEKYDDTESREIRENDKSRDTQAKLFKEPAKAKLRFGIEAILNVKERDERTNKDSDAETVRYKEVLDDEHLNDDKNLNKLDRHISTSYMESLLSKDERDDDVDDDDENIAESKDFKDLKFDFDVARARLAYMGYAASFSSPGLAEQSGLALQPNSFSPPFPVNNATYPWTGVSDIRKERFSMVRRIGHPYQNRTPPKRKKPRTSFTRLQILELEKRFERQKYLASTERSALAKTLKMTDAQVKTWFQNRRTKWRRQTAEEREIERQAANRLLMSLQSDPAHRKSMVMSPESVCLSHLQRWQEKRSVDI